MSFRAFKSKGHNASMQTTQVGQLVNLLGNNMRVQSVVTPAIGKLALSVESINDNDRHNLMAAASELSTSLEAAVAEMGLTKKSTDAQIEAGTIAGVLAGDYRGFLGHKLEMNSVSTESQAVVLASGLSDSVGERSFAMESYDERENRNAVLYSIAYNYQSARQDEFGETIFPTLTLSPDNVGFGVTVNLMMVYDGITRRVSGTFEDFKKKNIIRAVADASVLKKEQTRVIPIYRQQSADKFAVGIPAQNLVLEGETLPTAPLAFGKKVDLLGLSASDALVATGVQDMTDTLDPTVTLQNILIKVGDDVVKFSTSNLPLANFTYATQNNYRVQQLNFSTTSILLNKDTKAMDGSALVDLAGISAADVIVRLEVQISGNVNIETGELNVFGNALRVHSITNAQGDMLDLGTAPAAAIVAAIEGGKLLGYEVLAYRTNVNRRQRGQFIDVTKYTQLYSVPLRSPITTIHPINSDGASDASDVQALITATRIRTSNEAVTALLQAAETLSEYVDNRDAAGVGPDVLGVGRFFVRPVFEAVSLDVRTQIDSVKSHERAMDIQAVLVNKIRDMAYRMYRDSEYKAAADALAGGIAPVPTVVLATDPVLARYLNVSGDLRTLGTEFDVRIVSTIDWRMKGKIAITFGVFDETRNSQPNPLNFGNMVWAPELVLNANISRGNTISKELVVQPRYLFTVHCPIMGLLNVDGIADVVASKVPVNFHTV